ncbi:MAG: PaaI family thioesterase [Planctomycetes bacterium]|nr:PaaI family thioesterase [Planctomycetota bacterium]
MTREREERFGRAPVGAFFGFVLRERTSASARIELPPKQEFVQQEGRLHGGVIATLADTTAVWLVHPDLDDGQSMTSIEFKLNFLRAATVDGGVLVADAKLVKLGRTIALIDVEVAQGGELVAKGLFTYLMMTR